MIYKDWSFRLFIYNIILIISIVILLINYVPILGTKTDYTYERNLVLFEIMLDVTTLFGIVLIIISIFKKETKDCKFYIAFVGFSFVLVLSIIRFFLG
jgi:hypothetical protein